MNWTRPRTLRCSTITWRLSAAFSASSRLLGLKGEATRFNRKNISAIIAADVRRFGYPIKQTWFSAHTGAVFHTYSCFARGLDMMNATYHYLDLVPKGRDESGSHKMAWVRYRDSYTGRCEP